MVRIRNKKIVAYKTPESLVEYHADINLLNKAGMATEQYKYMKANLMLAAKWRAQGEKKHDF